MHGQLCGDPVSELLCSSKVGAVPKLLVQGPDPAHTQGVRRFIGCQHPFITPSLKETGQQR